LFLCTYIYGGSSQDPSPAWQPTIKKLEITDFVYSTLAIINAQDIVCIESESGDLTIDLV